MKLYLSVLLFFAITLLGGGILWIFDNSDSDDCHLNVATYSSFSSPWGAGPEIKKEFYDAFLCRLNFRNMGSAGMLLSQLKLNKGSVDVVLGLDGLNLNKALENFEWLPLNVDKRSHHALRPYFQQKFLVPFDWSPMTFIYRKNQVPAPQRLEDLLKYPYKLSLPSPELSSTGLHFLLWVFQKLKAPRGADYLKLLHPYNISPSWSSSYGLFKNGQANITFSYLTSVVYHWVNENDKNYQAAILKIPHPYQVELMGVPKSCHNCELAKDFVRFLLKDKIQKIIMEKNFMLPVRQNLTRGTPFENLPQPKIFLYSRDHKLPSWLSAWKDIF